MKFHPGGVEDLLKAAGKDATILFDEVYTVIIIPVREYYDMHACSMCRSAKNCQFYACFQTTVRQRARCTC